MNEPLGIPTVILFREDLDSEDERSICSKYFDTYSYRSEIPSDVQVIGRYSVLPFYRELDIELGRKNSLLINSYNEHNFLADIRTWYPTLEHLTPKTYENWSNLPKDKSFVVKGITNSRKHSWSTRMFAPTYKDVPEIAKSLLDDYLLNEQGLVVREYVPLKTFSIGINGLPITNEWRTFWIKDKLIAKGYYWSSNPELLYQATWTDEMMRVAQEAADIVSEFTNAFVIDLAETQEGSWIVIELNELQMSGLSCIRPDDFYSSLKKILES